MTEDNKSTLAALSTMLDKLINERSCKMRELGEARTILQSSPPPAFDHEGAGRAVAQARVADLMSGLTTAESISEEFERQRAANEKAISDHEKRHIKAAKQFDDADRLAQALTAQACEIDAAIRREFAGEACKLEADAEDAMGRSAARFIADYVNFKAVTWLRFAERSGERGKQFSFPDQYEVTLTAPESIAPMLPDGYHKGDGEAVIWRGIVFGRLINDRVNEIMGERSGGLYPKIAAALPNQDS